MEQRNIHVWWASQRTTVVQLSLQIVLGSTICRTTGYYEQIQSDGIQLTAAVLTDIRLT